MNDTYKTIGRQGKGIYKEKMSKFIAFATPVSSPEEARTFIKEIQNEYHDARHVCWAYMIGPERTVWQLNDNGEPSGTAGKPILGQINSRELTDVAVAVVRYFGGIKLGTSGLTAAYRESTSLALDDAGIEIRQQTRRFNLSFPYIAVNDIMKIVKQTSATIVTQKFDNSCQLTVELPLGEFEAIKERMLGVDGATECETTLP